MKIKVNDKSIWNEIYEKENFTPGWTSPGTDKNLLGIIKDSLSLREGNSFKILDIGCGNGRNSMVTESLDKFDISYTGADFADKAVEFCKRTHSESKKFIHLDITASNLPLESNYDIIMDCGCFHSIPLEARELYIKNIVKHSGSNTLLVIGAWWRAPEHFETKEPSYFPYLYLDEWFFNKNDISDIFGNEFEVLSELVDDVIYDGLNRGFAYFTLKLK